MPARRGARAGARRGSGRRAGGAVGRGSFRGARRPFGARRGPKPPLFKPRRPGMTGSFGGCLMLLLGALSFVAAVFVIVGAV